MTTGFGRLAALALAAGMLVSGAISASAQNNMGMSQTKGAAQTYHYRRAMQRYRYHPGARAELRRNRTNYCIKRPSRC